MQRITISAIAMLASSAAFANINHQALVNFPGGHTGVPGAHLSALEAGEGIFGYGAQGGTVNNIMADDFTVGAGGFIATGIRLYTYQTGATAPSITGANWALGAAPTTTLTNVALGSTWMDVGGFGVYRVTSTSTTDTNRRIQEVFIDIPDQVLTAGTWFLSVNFTGSLTSGPWLPPNPTSTSAFGKNAQQSIGGGAFAAVTQGSTGADLPFVIEGQPVPEPASMLALGLGAAALLRRRAKKA